jgi:hypothetical protein
MMDKQYKLITLEDYEPLIGAEEVERIHKKAGERVGLYFST